MLQRVTAAAVLREACVAIVGKTAVIYDDIFDNGAKPDSVPNHWLILLTQVNGFGVATPFKVEN